uniref:integrator complex subunit 6-like isoform X1 n=1 Tax=Myodes glareolus TaxID=447135 RepID=UPI0020201DB4|nr:integrator complex subunit 6-like isoform X1 [Myodes glareolus]
MHTRDLYMFVSSLSCPAIVCVCVCVCVFVCLCVFRNPEATMYPGFGLQWMRFLSGILSSSERILDPKEHRDACVGGQSPPTSQLSFSLCFPGATDSLKAQDTLVEGHSTTTKGSPKWVPSDKSTYCSLAGLLPEGGDATFTGLIVSSEIPASAPSAAARPDGEGVPAGNLVSREKFNAEIKRQLMKEIRRYGRKYGRLFELLDEVQGPLGVQIQFVEFAIKEAARFKRHHLIQFLEKKHEEMLFQLPFQQ